MRLVLARERASLCGGTPYQDPALPGKAALLCHVTAQACYSLLSGVSHALFAFGAGIRRQHSAPAVVVA